MKQKPLSSAAAVAIVATLILVAVYWRQLWHFILTLAVIRVAWAVARHQLGMKKSVRRGKSLWEVVAASLGGYILGARGARRGTHACGQCGHPIKAPSRAVYCSPACRKYAALERAETERKAERMAAFGDVPDGFGA